MRASDVIYPIEDHLPLPVDISVGDLLRLLADLPENWCVSAEDTSIILLIDEHDQPRGTIDIAQARLVLRNGLKSAPDSP